jgi:predicted RNA binding protein YcfA (HicA-like mRNA interferase family)
MPKLPGINHLRAVAALQKAGFRILREGGHIVMTDGSRILTIPRHNPVNAFTMAVSFEMPVSQWSSSRTFCN